MCQRYNSTKGGKFCLCFAKTRFNIYTIQQLVFQFLFLEFFCYEQFTSAQSNIRFITNKWTESVLTQFFFSNKIFITSRLIEGSLKNCLQTVFVIYRVTAWHPYYLKNTFTDFTYRGKPTRFSLKAIRPEF